MDLGIEDRTALVFGGGGGLGGAVARSLADEGARVVVADVNAEAAERTVRGIAEAGHRAVPLVWDLADLTGIDERVSWIEETVGPIQILVNNTGGPPPSSALGQDPAVWVAHFQSMVLSVIAICDRVVPTMRTGKWGRVITSTSSGVVAPIPNLGLSNALRSTLLGWSKTLATEVASDGITCNIVVPGRIGTARTKALDEARSKRTGQSLDETTAQSAASIPIGRYGKPEEYAGLVTFLASDVASYLTGSVYRVDGGYIASV